jgi:hypothetical protein
MEWNGKTGMQPVSVFKNLASPLILGIDAIKNLGTTYLTKAKKLQMLRGIKS